MVYRGVARSRNRTDHLLESKGGMVKAQIGDTVLFKIDTSDFGVWRPLLVTFVHDDGAVDGEVFFNVDQDKRYEWPSRKLFYGLSDIQRTVAVRNVQAGDKVGDFKFRLPGIVVGNELLIEDLQARMDKLEGQQRAPLTPARALTPEKRTK